MNKKKLITIFLILAFIGVVVYFISTHISVTNTAEEDYSDYTPQEEISDAQTKQTTINLYFLNSETQKIQSEGKLISASDLIENPYKFIVEKLIEGPSDQNLQSVFPDNTRLIDAKLTNNCVILNFSDDLLNFKDDTQKFNIINSILNTLAQLNEVNSIKILVNNEPNEKIDQEYSIISENT